MQTDLWYTGSRIAIRPATEADAENIVRWRNDPDVSGHFIHRDKLTVEGHLSWFRDNVLTGRTVQFIICVREQDAEGREERNPVGSVYLRDIDRGEMSAEYGVFIGEKKARGKGFGVEAARLAVRFAFEEMQLQRVFLRVYRDNTAAIRSYEAAGFRVCGELRGVVSTDGESADMLLMEVMPGEDKT